MSELLDRCASGSACVEVVTRLQAADLAVRNGHREHAERLRDTAARFAEIHHHGTNGLLHR